MQALSPSAAHAVVPRAASATLMLRNGAQGPELLMVTRSQHASFMPGAHIFPGGVGDTEDARAETKEPASMLAERIGQVTGVGEHALTYAAATLREEQAGDGP